jgi:hypothetical protein
MGNETQHAAPEGGSPSPARLGSEVVQALAIRIRPRLAELVHHWEREYGTSMCFCDALEAAFELERISAPNAGRTCDAPKETP